MPWVEYDPDSRSFLLEDGVSVGALFELDPVGTEARTPEFMVQLRDAVQTALTDAIPEEEHSPWVLQVYVQDEPSLQGFMQQVQDYSQPGAEGSAFRDSFNQSMAEHLTRISAPGGLFRDNAVTGSPWRGQVRRVRAALYRRLNPSGRLPPAVEVEEALNDVAIKWMAAMATAGVRVRRGPALRRVSVDVLLVEVGSLDVLSAGPRGRCHTRSAPVHQLFHPLQNSRCSAALAAFCPLSNNSRQPECPVGGPPSGDLRVSPC